MANYSNYNGITLYKGSKRLDIGCTDNLQKKIPVITKLANSDTADMSEFGNSGSSDRGSGSVLRASNPVSCTKLYPNKCYWLINVPKNGTIILYPTDTIKTEKNKNIVQSASIDEKSITITSSWVQSDNTKAVANANIITNSTDTDVEEIKNRVTMPKATENYTHLLGEGIKFSGYTFGEDGLPIISDKFDSRFKAEHLKEEANNIEFPDDTASPQGIPERAFQTPHILVEYYVLFAPNGTNTIGLPEGYYFADNPRNMTFTQDESGAPTVYEIHICNDIVRIGKAMNFDSYPSGGGSIVA